MVAYKIITFLLDVVAGLIGGACLLRLYMQWQRIPFSNPLGRFVFAITDWIVLPLRKVLPAVRKFDTASFVAVVLVELAEFTLLWLISGRPGGPEILLVLTLFGVIRLTISAVIGLMIVYAVLSWVQNDSVLSDLIDRLAAPLLRPIRKIVPLMGGVDLSPLVFIVAMYVLLMLLDPLQAAALSL
ncbi:YggT family protein [Ramlibacter sp. PS4R-6]|uniref:YggT family protein n=1 Tax=Ramlibacter sp. PS4R-6 TaxID=3133438 RepID=UPI0030B0D5D7